MSDSAAPKWAKWKHIPHAEVWQVVVLSCGFEPEYLQPEIERGRSHRREQQFAISTRVPEEYYDRLDVVIANLGVRIKVVVLDGNDSGCSKIALTEFADFAEACGWQLPADFPRKATPLAPHSTTLAAACVAESLGAATDFFDDPYWSMLQVIAWVTTRAPALVHKASDNFKWQQRHSEMLNTPSGSRMCEIPSEPVNWVDVTMHATLREIAIGGTARTRLEVEREIVRSLESGRLTATGFELGQSKPAEILRTDWAYLELFEDDRLGICARNKCNPKKYELRFSGLKVPRDEVLAQWPQEISELPAAVGRDSVITLPAGTQYWPVADLPELIAQALSPHRCTNLSDVAKHRAAIVHARKSNQLNAVSPTNRLPADPNQGDAEASIVDIQSYVQKFEIAIRLAPPKWGAETVETMTKATHWTERELEAACFGFPLTMYHDLCVPEAKREVMRGAIEQACKSGELVAECSGRGNAMYGGRWRIERLSAVRWAIRNCPNFPDRLASANSPDIFAQQDTARESAGRYTLRQASEEIARHTGESANELVEKFKRTVRDCNLAVHRPGERARYYPETVREFYEEAYWDDLNSWLGANEPRIEWRFTKPLRAEHQASAENAEIHVKSKQRRSSQEETILRLITSMGFEAMAIPKATPGKRGIKAQVKAMLRTEPGWEGSIFDKAWQRLRDDGRIRDKTD